MNGVDCWFEQYTKKKHQLYEEANQVISFKRKVEKLFEALIDWLKENQPPPGIVFKDNSVLKGGRTPELVPKERKKVCPDEEYTELYCKYMESQPSLPHFCEALDEPKKPENIDISRSSSGQYLQNDTAEIESSPELKTPSRPDAVEQARRGIEGKRNPQTGEESLNDGNAQKRHRGTPDKDALEVFLKEGASLQEKTLAEIGVLKALVEAKSVRELQRSPVEALRAYYRIVRMNEEPPACFGGSELAKLCSSWVCKHRRAWCLRERSYILLLRSQRDKAMESHRKQLESLVISGASCKQEACCIDRGFCSGCSCNLCKSPIQSNGNSWSYIGCRKCLHVAHLECALDKKKAGVVPEKDLDMESICTTCGEKTDLVLFWKMMIKEGLATADRGLLEKSLSAAARVAEGTKRVYFQPLIAKLKTLRNSAPEENQKLVQALKEVVDSIGEYDDRLMDESVVSEILEAGERFRLDVKHEETRAEELQKKAELEYSEWLGAEKLAEARRLLLKQMQEELERAENEAELRRESAAASRVEFQKAEKRVLLLKMLKKINGVSGNVVGLQRWNCDQELARLEVLQKRIDRAKVDKLPVLYKAMEAQNQRLRAAHSHLKQLSCLLKLLSDESDE